MSGMGRREFVALLGGAAAAWPMAARAQQGGGLPRVVCAGLPLRQDEPDARDRLSAFRVAFEKKGWVDGRNVRIDYSFNGIVPGGERAIAEKSCVRLQPSYSAPAHRSRLRSDWKPAPFRSSSRPYSIRRAAALSTA